MTEPREISDVDRLHRGAAKHKVFISYSRQDGQAFADELAGGLEFQGSFEVSLDRYSIVEGEDWRQRLGALILDADTVVFIVTPSSVSSEICHWEVDEAGRLSKRIHPVLWIAPQNGHRVPDRLAKLNYTRFDEGRSFIVGLKALVSALNTDLDWVREHTRLLARALEWENSNRVENRMLTGPDIVAAKDWAARRPKQAPELTAHHLDFIRASEEAEIARNYALARQHEERERLLRVAEQAAEDRAKALASVDEAQRARSLQQHRASAALIAIAVLIFGGFAWLLFEGRNTFIREARLLASLSALAVQDEHYDKAIRLALGALPTDGNIRFLEPAIPEVRARLAGALLRNRLIAIFSDADKSENGHIDMTTWRMLRGYPLIKASFSRDGSKIAAALGSRTAAVWDAKTARRIITLQGHRDVVVSARFSIDGKRIITGSFDGTAKLWDVDTGTALKSFGDHSGPVLFADFSPSGKFILTVSNDGTAQVWDAETFERLKRLEGVGKEVFQAQFSVDEKRLAFAGDGDGTLWDCENWSLVSQLAPRVGLLSVSFNSDSSRLVAGTADNAPYLFDGRSGLLIKKMEGHNGWIWAARFSPDDKLLVSGSSDGVVRIWDAATGEDRGEFRGHKNWVSDVSFDNTSTKIVSASRDGTARLWTVSRPSPHAPSFMDLVGGNTRTEEAILVGHGQAVWSASFDASGQFVLTASSDRTARLWHTEAPIGSELQEPADHPLVTTINLEEPPAASEPSKRLGDGQILALRYDIDRLVVREKQALVVASVDDHRLIANIPTTSSVFAAALSSSGNLLGAISQDGKIQVWKITEGLLIASVDAGKEANEIYFDGEVAHYLLPRGTTLIEGTITAQKTPPVETSIPVELRDGDISSVWLSPTKHYLAAASKNGRLFIYALRQAVDRLELRGHQQRVRHVAFDELGTRIATISLDGSAGLWDLKSGERIASFYAGQGLNDRAEGWVNEVNFSPNHRWLLVSLSDGSVLIADARSGERVISLATGQWAGGIGLVHFTTDGHLIKSLSHSWNFSLADVVWSDGIRASVCKKILLNESAQSLSAEERKGTMWASRQIASNPCTWTGPLNWHYYMSLLPATNTQ